MSFPNTNWEQLKKTIHLDGFNPPPELNKNFILSFSGGADSVLALYYLVHIQKYFPVKNRKLVIYFLNHGEHNDRVIKERENILHFHLNQLQLNPNDFDIYREFFYRDMEKISHKVKKNFEYTSSRLRRKHLEKLLRKYPNSILITGHNMSDWFETVLLRLNRGTDLSRLYPFLPFEKENGLEFLRPLVFLSHQEVRDICQKLQLSWWEDPTNRDGSNQRSRMRNNSFITNAEGLRISCKNLAKKKSSILKQKEDFLRNAKPHILEISKGREYRIEASYYFTHDANNKNILLDFMLQMIKCWPISGNLRKAAENHCLDYKNLHIHTENWNDILYLVTRRGRKILPRNIVPNLPTEKNISMGLGDIITKKHFIQRNYGRKSVKKIFSEKKLSSRQIKSTLVYLNPDDTFEVFYIQLSPYGLKDIVAENYDPVSS